jgi:hypothetical protein
LNQPVLRTLAAAKNLAYRLQRYMLTDEDSISKHGNDRNGRTVRKHTRWSQGFDLSKILFLTIEGSEKMQNETFTF